MNTCITMSFAIRKRAKFMQFPGKQHFLYLKHLLRHLQSNRCSSGIKFYSNVQLSPLYQFMVDNGNVEHALAPIIQFIDSSFQDCPDTSRSTGGYLTFMQGAVVEAVSTMPTIVSQSTCEAEYCIASLSGCKLSNKNHQRDTGPLFGSSTHNPRRKRLPIGNWQSKLPERNQPHASYC
jgi:hypothetical protein